MSNRNSALRQFHGGLVAVGDVHGELEGLKAVLRHAGAVDARGRWAGGDMVVVQVGDVIDRGPSSLAAWEYLASLQRQAQKRGGKVVRLLGNHEIELLKGNEYLTTLEGEDIAPFIARLKDEIGAGQVLAAFLHVPDEGGEPVLFTHAGLRSSLREELLDGRDVALLADVINERLRDAVSSGDYSHAMFQAGHSRGGSRPIGGLFWEDAKELFASLNAGRIRQVFGHSVRRGITQSADGRLIDVDTGMCRVYGGRRNYLRIHEGKPEAVNCDAPSKGAA